MRVTSILVVGLVFGTGTGLAAQGLGPSGATARCQDGAYTHNKVQSEACRDHDGIEVWFGLAPNEAVAAQKRTDIYAVLEAAMAEEKPNTVARADLTGTIEDRFTPDSADIVQYRTFMVYLDHARQVSGCRKMSNHCALCPGSHQIYCTNVEAFLPLMAF